MIRTVKLNDAKPICDIYNYYIKNTTVTFEEEAVSTDEMENRINAISYEFPWHVYEVDGKVVGYAYVTKWKARTAYRYSVESTVYIDVNYKGRGIGTSLYKHLLEELKKRGFHSVVGGIALPNDASIALHEKLGFAKVAHFKNIGFKFDKWVDVGYWQYRFGGFHENNR